MSSYGPHVAERVKDRPRAIAIKLVFYRAERFGSAFDGFLYHRVNIFNIDVQARGKSANRLGAHHTGLWILVGQHYDGVTDFQLRVHNSAVGSGHAHEFRGSE